MAFAAKYKKINFYISEIVFTKNDCATRTATY
ncbi:MAG: hypothetical protein ACJASU_001625 [Cognaticolwellia sp.]|jgi:hypothetical protein